MNSSRRRLPISTQSFEKLRKQGDLYVDKTQYIEKLFSLGNVFFLSRPHRFGKSLFLSMLKAYFEGKKELFAGLYIAEREEEIARQQNREPWEESPVLYFDLNAKDYAEQGSLKSRMDLQLTEFERLHGVENRPEDLDDRFIYLVTTIYRKTQKQVVILIDEYDKPLLETVTNEELNSAIRAQLKAFYEVLKQCDQYIRFAFLTGITKFSKTTLFSGVNNLIDITLQDEYAAICGFTETELDLFAPEIERLAEKQKSTVKKTRARLKKEYDGYCFSSQGERLYDPSCLLNTLAVGSYNYSWFENATPTYLVKFLKKTGVSIPNLDENIKIDANVLQDFRYNDPNYIIHYLFYSGYLTIKKYLRKENLFVLGFPNKRVRSSFSQGLLYYTRPDVSPMGLLVDHSSY